MDIDELMQQAKLIQQKMEKTHEDLLNTTVKGESGGGLVVVTMNGRHDVKGVKIDPQLMSENAKMLEDLLAAAFNDAVQKVESLNKDSISSLTKGIDLPDEFKMPV